MNLINFLLDLISHFIFHLFLLVAFFAAVDCISADPCHMPLISAAAVHERGVAAGSGRHYL